VEGIFDKNKKFVDTKLAEICPKALETLLGAYNDLICSKIEYDWKKVAFACRDVQIEVTEAIYKPEYLPQGEKAPSKDQVKNKVRYTLMAVLKGSKAEERRLTEIQLEFLEKLIEYVDRLVDFTNKHLHKRSDREDAKKCIIYTYLIISDILKEIQADETVS
jgi:hypothetical protein